MAAVSPASSVHRASLSSSLSAAHSFLLRAFALHRALLAVHRDTDPPLPRAGDAAAPDETTLDVLAGRLQGSVALLQLGSDPAAPLADALARACRKVGQDVALRLERVGSLCFGVPTNAIDKAKFRELWSAQDVDALGARLRELARRCNDIDPAFSSPVRQLLGSTLLLTGTTAPGENDPAGSNPHQASRDQQPLQGSAGENSQKQPFSSMLDNDSTSAKIPSRPRPTPDGLLYDFILDSLAYKSMRYRQQEVTKAHRKTFEWAFTQPASADQTGQQQGHRFSTWLRGDELGPIYWITGKPGSGKSTLLRFLFDHASTVDRLQDWADGQDVCRAGFFFWTSGSREQRSQTGLLRSLLHQLLSAASELIPLAFPALWKRLRVMTTKERIQLVLDWPTPELMAAFLAFVDAAVPQMKICLFIDGLDEFEGDHGIIIDFFKNLSLRGKGRSIKLCLSSRPWAVFQEAFQYQVPNLKLQDLTYEDMYRYARDRLRENVHVRRLLKNDPAAREALIKRTVQKADGVFLWVRLALNEMVGRLRPAASLADLSETLQALPTELYDLFTKLLFEDQDHVQLAEAAALFQLMRAREIVADFVRDDSANALTVWELAFALDREDDDLAIEGVVEEAQYAIIQERCATTAERIWHRFAGLLDLHASWAQGNLRGPRFADEASGTEEALYAAQNRVTYIHRTVRDWLMEDAGVLARLTKQSPAGFDPHLRLLRSYVLRLKRPLKAIEHHRRLDEWWPDIALAMTHARLVRQDPDSRQRPLLNELDRTLSWYWARKPQDPYDHWARNAFGSYEVRMKAPPIWQPFLCLATKFGLARYVQEELIARAKADDDDDDDDTSAKQKQKRPEPPDATPLLAYATEFLCSRSKTLFPLSDPRLVELLLLRRDRRHGNPGANHEYLDFSTRRPTTPWLTLLCSLRDARRRGWIERYDVDPAGTARWAEVVRLFLEVGGADAKAAVAADRWDPAITALGVLELLDETYGAVEVHELRGLVEGLQG